MKLPRLLVLTDRTQCRGSLPATVASAVDAGARAVVLREKDLPADERALDALIGYSCAIDVSGLKVVKPVTYEVGLLSTMFGLARSGVGVTALPTTVLAQTCTEHPRRRGRTGSPPAAARTGRPTSAPSTSRRSSWPAALTVTSAPTRSGP